jgi:hypothetical protein
LLPACHVVKRNAINAPQSSQRAKLQPFRVNLSAHGQRITSEQKPGRMAGQKAR